MKDGTERTRFIEADRTRIQCWLITSYESIRRFNIHTKRTKFLVRHFMNNSLNITHATVRDRLYHTKVVRRGAAYRSGYFVFRVPE